MTLDEMQPVTVHNEFPQYTTNVQSKVFNLLLLYIKRALFLPGLFYKYFAKYSISDNFIAYQFIVYLLLRSGYCNHVYDYSSGKCSDLGQSIKKI